MKILPLYRAVRCGAEVAQCDTRNGPRRSMRADGNNTEWTMCLEFNAGGSLPSKLVNGFVYGQSKLFAHMSKYFAKGCAEGLRVSHCVGAARKNVWDKKLIILSRSVFNGIILISYFEES